MHHLVRRSASKTLTTIAVPWAVTAAVTLALLGCSQHPSAHGPRSPEAADPGKHQAAPPPQATEIATPDGPITVADHILAKYTELGGPEGVLGKPAGPAVAGPDSGACQDFSGGAICWSDKTASHVVWGDIRAAWESDGGVDGRLGYPVSDEKDILTGKEGDFTGGVVTWSQSTGQTAVTVR